MDESQRYLDQQAAHHVLHADQGALELDELDELDDGIDPTMVLRYVPRELDELLTVTDTLRAGQVWPPTYLEIELKLVAKYAEANMEGVRLKGGHTCLNCGHELDGLECWALCKGRGRTS